MQLHCIMGAVACHGCPKRLGFMILWLLDVVGILSCGPSMVTPWVRLRPLEFRLASVRGGGVTQIAYDRPISSVMSCGYKRLAVEMVGGDVEVPVASMQCRASLDARVRPAFL